MFEKIIKMFYPSRCIFCNKLLEYDSKLEICDVCYKELSFLEDQDEGTKYCDRVLGVFNYDDKIKEIIQKFKYHNKAYLYRTFAKLMVMRVGSKLRGDIIISVPLYKDREFVRGYNQSHLLAKELSHITGIKYDRHVLVRKKNTGALALCDSQEIENKIKGSFSIVDPDKVAVKSVFIVDDVFTTGATINECSRVLKENNANDVTAVVVAKTILWLQRNNIYADIPKG